MLKKLINFKFIGVFYAFRAIVFSGIIFSIIVMEAPLVFSATTAPVLPRTYVDTTYPSLSSSRTVRYVKGACAGVTSCTTSLQEAIDRAVLGDEIVVDAGIVIEGPIVLREKPEGNKWIIIRSANLPSLPKAGKRINPKDAPNMPKIVATGKNTSALTTEDRAHHYRLVGIEFKEKVPDDDSNVLVQLGPWRSYCPTAEDAYAPCGSMSVLDNYPYNIILDRVYIHGEPTHNVKRGVGLDTKNSAIIDSYISDIHVVGQDSQAIAGLYGPGPYKITNNYLEASTENLIFGGDDPRIVGLVPSDIEIRGNYFNKPPSWRVGDPSYAGKHWAVKNLLELKNAKRVLVEGNVLERSWQDGQAGFAVLFTVRNQGGKCTWCVVSDVTFQNNIVRHAGGGISILGHDDSGESGLTERIMIHNNLWEDIDKKWGGSGWWALLDGGNRLPGPSDVTITHNTIFQSGSFLVPASYFKSDGSYSTKPNFTVTDNIASHNQYGVLGDNSGVGDLTLKTYFPGIDFTKNILRGGPAKSYASYSGNYFPESWVEVFVDQPGGDYRILPGSIYSKAGTDGKDLGADMEAVKKATSGAVLGGSVATSPAPVVPKEESVPEKTPVSNFEESTPKEEIPGSAGLVDTPAQPVDQSKENTPDAVEEPTPFSWAYAGIAALLLILIFTGVYLRARR